MTPGRRAVGVAVAVILVGGLVVALTRGSGSPSVGVSPAQQGSATGCQSPGGGAVGPPSQPVAPSARVAVPGATSVDTQGLTPSLVAETADGRPWVIVRDPRATKPAGLVARVDPAREALASVTPVVDHCTLTAISAEGSSVWVGTCDPSGVGGAADAELVRVDSQGQIGARVAVPTACVRQVAAGATTVWATSAPSSAGTPRLFRLDTTTGRVDEPGAATGEQLNGLAVAGDDPWTARTAASGSRLVRTDHGSGADAASVPAGPSLVGGIVAGSLWSEDTGASALVARDVATGTVTATVPVSNLQAFAVGGSGVWYEQASTAGLTITVGRLGGGNAPATVTTFTGPGPDRTGLPFLGTLSVTARGAWLASQDHLFLLPA